MKTRVFFILAYTCLSLLSTFPKKQPLTVCGKCKVDFPLFFFRFVFSLSLILCLFLTLALSSSFCLLLVEVFLENINTYFVRSLYYLLRNTRKSRSGLVPENMNTRRKVSRSAVESDVRCAENVKFNQNFVLGRASGKFFKTSLNTSLK